MLKICSLVDRHNGLNVYNFQGKLNMQSIKKRFSSSLKGSIQVHQSHVEVRDNAFSSQTKQSFKFSYLWLRDHCRCNVCYNYITNQRKFNVLEVFQKAAPTKCVVSDLHLNIEWNDGHQSRYSHQWLAQHCYRPHPQEKVKPRLWKAGDITDMGIFREDMNTFMNTDVGLANILLSIIKYGVAFVENVPPTILATQQVATRIAHVHRTFFGDMWEFSDKMDHCDTAYSRGRLSAHTDNTYFSEAAGLQVFHCLSHDGSGGETLLVDGFHAADILGKHHPDSYHCLTNYHIESEYIENGKHYIAFGPILRLCPKFGNLEQIRFNLSDRAPMSTIPYEQHEPFYKDLTNLATIISDPGSEWWFKLLPATVLFVDNWRILHGRAAYSGHRSMAGCYLGRSDWLSRARALGLV